ncbi:unnamed protein product, partial [marine sediment metagenome]
MNKKKEKIGKLRGMGWAQEGVAKVVGIEQSRISQIEKESIINIDIALLPGNIKVAFRYIGIDDDENKE